MSDTLPDLDRVRAFLRARCDDDAGLDGLEINHVNPGDGGSLKLLLEGPAPDGGVRRFAARRLGAEKGRRLEASMNERHGPQAAIYAPDLQLLFQAFPADYRLESLAQAMDPHAMTPVLEAALSARAGGRGIGDLRVEAVRYKPSRKAVLRYELDWEPETLGEPPPVVYARVARPRTYARLRDTLPRLHAARDALGFDLPEPLGAVPRLGMTLFSAVPGVPLSQLAGRAQYPALCRRTGAALHDLHHLPVTLEARFDGDGLVERLPDVAHDFARLLPARRERIEALAGELVARLAGTPPAAVCLLHGDFHGDNVLVEGDRLGLIDLEDCAMGDPAYDVASWWTQLRRDALRSGSPLADAACRAFLEGYLERADAATIATLPGHAALMCFLNAFQAVRRTAADAADADLLLATCEDVLAEG